MNLPFPPTTERWRRSVPGWESSRGDDFGVFFPRLAPRGPTFKVIASAGDEESGILWEHVSASLPSRCPTWDEMCAIKALFWRPDEVVVQYHPAESEYVNNHPFCLHLWRPCDGVFPVPPSIAVGYKGVRAEVAR